MMIGISQPKPLKECLNPRYKPSAIRIVSNEKIQRGKSKPACLAKKITPIATTIRPPMILPERLCLVRSILWLLTGCACISVICFHDLIVL